MKTKTIALNEVTVKITPFERELLAMFPRTRFVQMMWDLKAKEDKLCGYMPRKKVILFTCDLPRLSHEIAHMVEMNDFDRLIKDDWGMSLTDNFGGDKAKFNDPTFALRATARECRVKAIESLMCKSSYSLNRVLHHNWYDIGLYPKLHTESKFGRFKTTKDIDDWMRSIFESTKRKWSFDRIRHEWIKRVNYIRNWQETI